MAATLFLRESPILTAHGDNGVEDWYQGPRCPTLLLAAEEKT